MGFSTFALQRTDIDNLLAEAQADPANNSPAMNELVRRFRPMTRSHAVRLARRHDLVEELASTGDIAVVRAVRRHNPSVVGFPSYARQTCFRSQQRRCIQITRPERDRDGRSLDGLHDDPTLADVTAVVGDLDQALSPWGDGELTTAVEALPENWQTALRLKFVDDLSNSEIGYLTGGVTASAVSQTITRAIAQLRQTLDATTMTDTETA